MQRRDYQSVMAWIPPPLAFCHGPTVHAVAGELIDIVVTTPRPPTVMIPPNPMATQPTVFLAFAASKSAFPASHCELAVADAMRSLALSDWSRPEMARPIPTPVVAMPHPASI